MKLPKKNLSADIFCVNPHQTGIPALFLVRMTKAAKSKWCEMHDLHIGLMNGTERVFAPVSVKGCLYWMDAVTGSLYGNDGRCQSSSQLVLELDTLQHNHASAITWLMTRTTEERK